MLVHISIDTTPIDRMIGGSSLSCVIVHFVYVSTGGDLMNQTCKGTFEQVGVAVELNSRFRRGSL